MHPSPSLFGFLTGITLATAVLLPAEEAAPVAEWRFEYAENLLWIRADAGGHRELIFILDTAATEHVLDAQAATRMGIPLAGEAVVVRRTDAELSHRRTSPLNLRVGETSLGRASLLVLPLNDQTPDRRVMDGILGAPLFEAYVVQVDYPRRKIRLFPKDTVPSLEGAISHDLHSSDRLMGVRLQDSQGGKGLFVVDTGCSKAVIVSPHALSGFSAGQKGATVAVYGAGKMEARRLEPTAWRMGSQQIPGLQTLCCQAAEGGLLADRAWSGIIGNGLLSKFKATFDWGHRKLHLQPAAQAEG